MDSFEKLNTPFVWAVVCSIAAIVSYQVLFSPLRAFPGPFVAKFTDIRRAIAAASGHFDRKNLAWHQKYGSAVRVGPNCISISDPSLIKTVFATKNAWSKSDMVLPNQVLVNGQRVLNLFNMQDIDFHEKYTKPVRGLFTMTKVLDYEPYIDETLNKFTEKLGAKFADPAGAICMMDDWLTYFAWDVMANLSFGRHYGFLDQEKDVNNLIVDSTKGLYYFAPVSQMPWLDSILDKNPIMRIGPKPTLTGVLYAFGVVASYQQELKATNQKAGTGSVEHSLDKYVKLKELYPDLVDDNQIANYLLINILAGGDTTASIMRAVVYYLSKNVSAYGKLVAELDAAELSLPAKWKDIHELPYLDAVIREAFRFNPGIALMLERVVPPAGFTLPDGRFLPGGTVVGMNPAVTTRDVEIFGQDADKFNPDRWVKADGESVEAFRDRSQKMKTVADFVFGAGNRVCIGKYLANLEIYKLFATLYSMFDIKLVDNNHEWKYHNAWFVYQENIPMKISRRAKAL